MRQIFLLLGLLLSLLTPAQAAETFKLATGETLTGEMLLSSANDTGVQIKVGEGDYTRVSWASFTQEDLKKLAKNPKLEPLVEPFIEITREERMAKTDVRWENPPRLEVPAKQSLLGAMFSSGVGLFLLLMMYAANIYAAFEIAIFRARSPALVCGLAAVVPFVAPIVFMAMPTDVKSMEETLGLPTGEAAPAEGPINPMLDPNAAHPSSLALHHEEATAPAHPPATHYARGQTTFNRRFFETKFPGFFGAVRRDADKDMVLLFKTGKGEMVAERISRISASDVHLAVKRGGVEEEVSLHFTAIQEVVHKHKDA